MCNGDSFYRKTRIILRRTSHHHRNFSDKLTSKLFQLNLFKNTRKHRKGVSLFTVVVSVTDCDLIYAVHGSNKRSPDVLFLRGENL